MVTSDRAPPQIAEFETTCCKVCNTAFPNTFDSTEMQWCEPCHSFQNVYRGPRRKDQCKSCFNRVGTDSKGRSLCAAMMYQMPDGTWRDRYNQDHRGEYRQGGMEKICHPIKPTPMTVQYVCECYEELKPGETRESIQISDPLRFYDRSRFW